MGFIAAYSFFSIWAAVFVPLITVAILLLLIYKRKRKTPLVVATIIMFALAFLALVALGLIILWLYSTPQG